MTKQVSIHVVQNRHIGTQTSHCDKTSEGNYHLKLCTPFVGLAPMPLLCSNMPVLYHVDGNLQRANYVRVLKWQILILKISDQFDHFVGS